LWRKLGKNGRGKHIYLANPGCCGCLETASLTHGAQVLVVFRVCIAGSCTACWY
jgi:hypothetical protein